ERIAFRRAHDKPGLHLEANPAYGLVVYTDRTMHLIWLVAYLAWQALIEQSGPAILSTWSGQRYAAIVEADPKFEVQAASVDRLATAFNALHGSPEAALPWPP